MSLTACEEEESIADEGISGVLACLVAEGVRANTSDDKWRPRTSDRPRHKERTSAPSAKNSPHALAPVFFGRC